MPMWFTRREHFLTDWRNTLNSNDRLHCTGGKFASLHSD
jgi:hypothetical protein